MKQVLVILLFVAATAVGLAMFGPGRQAISAVVAAPVAQATTAPAEEAPAAPSEEATADPAEEAAAAPVEEATTETTTTTGTLAEAVRESTRQFQEIEAAKDAGYGLLHGCVSGPNGGAMGVHYANGDLVGDGKIALENPEALIYEQSYGKLRLVGVEYVVLAADWDANNAAPPVLMGQLFNLNGAPNRYGIPAFYELHVWAWKLNPTGTFADWNPLVSCDDYTGDASMAGMGQ